MRSIVITGANRGIGLELVKQLLAHPTSAPEIVIATTRSLSGAKDLQEIAKKNKRLHILELDNVCYNGMVQAQTRYSLVCGAGFYKFVEVHLRQYKIVAPGRGDMNNYESYPKFVSKVSDIVGEKGLTVLVNNAGILIYRYGPLDDNVNADMLLKHLNTNMIAQILLTKEFLPLLKKSANANSDTKFGINKAAICYMSSYLGSVSNNQGETGGNFWGYRESKAALNMACRSITKEVKNDGIAVLILHPGWVQTDLGGPQAPVPLKDSITGIVKVMLELDEKTNGRFIMYDGVTLPW